MNAALAILALFGIPVLLAASAIWRGFVLSLLWAWFIVPLFGLPALSIPYAIGLSIVVGFLSHQAGKVDDDQNWGSAVTVAALYPALALLAGWIVTKFI